MPSYNFFSQKCPTMGVAIATMVLLLLNLIEKTLYHFDKITLKFLLNKILYLLLCFSLYIKAENLTASKFVVVKKQIMMKCHAEKTLPGRSRESHFSL